MDSTVSFSMEFDLTPEQAAAAGFFSDRRTYACEGCECGRELLVARVASGFDVTLVDPEFEAWLHGDPTVRKNPASRYGDRTPGYITGNGLGSMEIGAADD